MRGRPRSKPEEVDEPSGAPDTAPNECETPENRQVVAAAVDAAILAPFFDEKTERSTVKSRIVTKYFGAWAKVVRSAAKAHAGRIAYIDLFAGPGRYLDDSKSTPLMILEQAIQDEAMRQMLVSQFNDRDRSHAHALQKAIESLTGVEKLKYAPQIHNDDVGDQSVRAFEGMRLIPTFFFVDPWGYKGLSLRLVNSVLKDWGCDCVFFFNYNRISMGLMNAKVEEHMNQLFGKERADALRTRLPSLDPVSREREILGSLIDALKEMGGTFVLPFCFKNDAGTRTSHYLIFVSKNFRGYEIMKPIMAAESSSQSQGVPSFEYSPAARRNPTLFPISRPLDDLEEMLLANFSGRTLTMRAIYEQHSNGRPYLSANYKEALRNLEVRGAISSEPGASDRPKRKGVVTFADEVRVTFPSRRK